MKREFLLILGVCFFHWTPMSAHTLGRNSVALLDGAMSLKLSAQTMIWAKEGACARVVDRNATLAQSVDSAGTTVSVVQLPDGFSVTFCVPAAEGLDDEDGGCTCNTIYRYSRALVRHPTGFSGDKVLVPVDCLCVQNKWPQPRGKGPIILDEESE